VTPKMKTLDRGYFGWFQKAERFVKGRQKKGGFTKGRKMTGRGEGLYFLKDSLQRRNVGEKAKCRGRAGRPGVTQYGWTGGYIVGGREGKGAHNVYAGGGGKGTHFSYERGKGARKKERKKGKN